MNQTMYFKIVYGYSPEDYIEIEEKEVQKAYYCFLEKKDAVFTGGATRGSEIKRIVPDFHRIMGWNRGYKMETLDFAELKEKGIDRKAQHFLSESKQKVEYLIQTKQLNLLGTNFELPKQVKEISEGVKQLADKFSIK